MHMLARNPGYHEIGINIQALFKNLGANQDTAAIKTVSPS